MTVELDRAQFQRISALVHSMCGISLQGDKEALVRARLAKRLRVLGIANFDEYLDYIEHDKSGAEIVSMIDSLTTNKTGFFREPRHFEFIKNFVLSDLIERRKEIRIWSAGCSSGEEPFSIAILLSEEMPGIERVRPRILATDISSRMLARCREAVYDETALQGMPEHLIEKYFSVGEGLNPASERRYRVGDEVRLMVHFARLNLMDPWPMKGTFDIIFCRNVMIYFDKQTQQELVRRFHELLEPGGHLLVGHSESLTASSPGFRCVQPATYMKTAA